VLPNGKASAGTSAVGDNALLETAPLAVAVILCPSATFLLGEKAKEALPNASVEVSFCPMNFLPSLPEGFVKNWTT
jgi:hypothetical protein